jgi:hypothetical protein
VVLARALQNQISFAKLRRNDMNIKKVWFSLMIVVFGLSSLALAQTAQTTILVQEANKMQEMFHLTQQQRDSIFFILSEMTDKAMALREGVIKGTITPQNLSVEVKKIQDENDKQLGTILKPEQIAQWKQEEKKENDAKKKRFQEEQERRAREVAIIKNHHTQ